jgi:predicted nucleic acid-binding protein
MAVAAENSCRMLLSEDLQPGFIWRGVTVVNPFASPSSALLENLLQAGDG